MRTETSIGSWIILFLFFPFLLILAIPVFPAAELGNFYYLLIIFSIASPPIMFSSSNFITKFILTVLLGLSVIYMVFAKTFMNNKMALSLPKEMVSGISGTLVYDSSISSNENTVINIYVDGVQNKVGDKLSSKGLVTLVLREQALLTAGTKVYASGAFTEDGLFICEDLEVVDKSRINQIRESLINIFTKRILGKENNEENLLSLMLITGRAESSELKIKELASKAGCLHVLALSGMHLNFISLAIRKITGDKKYSFYIALVFVLAFVFVAGPRPSLLRALISFILSKTDKHLRLVLTLIIQAILFPFSISNIGSVYAYISVLALVVYAPYVCSALSVFLPKFISNLVGASATVLVLTAPIQMISNGSWVITSIIASPVSAVLALVSMLGGFMSLATGVNKVTSLITKFSYVLLEKIFSLATQIQPMRILGYLIYTLVIILMLVGIKLYRNRIMKHVKCKLLSTHSQEMKVIQDDLQPDLRCVKF